LAEILITGATGFIGSHLSQRLKKLGADVVLLSHSKVKSGTYHSDLLNFYDCVQLILQHSPKIIFHLAAQPLVESASRFPFNSMEVNIRGAYNLLEAIRQAGNPSAIVWMSTDKVYGEQNFSDKTKDIIIENDPLLGVHHPYDLSKLCGEYIARMYSNSFNLPIVVVRSGNIYGEADFHWSRLIPGVSRDLLMGQRPKIRSNGKLKRDYIYIDDAINGLILASASILKKEIKSGEVINFGSDKPYSVLEIVDQLAGLAGRVDLVPIIEDRVSNEINYQHLDYSFAQKYIGWNPKTPLNVGLEKTFYWYKSYFGGQNDSGS